MFETIDDIRKEIDIIKSLQGNRIKSRQRMINELGIFYLLNKNKFNISQEEHESIINFISKYQGEYENIMKEATIKYLQQKGYIFNDIKVLRKNSGVQAGIIILINNTEKYFIKTHQYGSTTHSGTKGPLDIKELYIYKLLYNIGLGPECHWFVHESFPSSVYIMTKELYISDITIDRELIKLDLICRILCLNDVVTNVSNITQHTDNKAYILDFRNDKILSSKNPYIYNEIYESFVKGNKTVNYSYNKYFADVMINNHNTNKMKLANDIIFNEFNNFIEFTQITLSNILNDDICKSYDTTDLLTYISNICTNYNNLKSSLAY